MKRKCMWGLIVLSFTVCGCNAVNQDNGVSRENTVSYENTISGEETAQENTASEEASIEEPVSSSEETAASQEIVSTSSETRAEETNCDGMPVWSFNDDSLGEDWNGMLSGYSFTFENWTEDGAEYRDGFWYKHCEYPLVTAWDIEFYSEPSLEAETVQIPCHAVLYAEATDKNEWIYFSDSEETYSGWLHLMKEPNVMYRIEAKKGMIQLDQLFNYYETECFSIYQGKLEENNPILPEDSEEKFKILAFKNTEELSVFIQMYEPEMKDSPFLADLKKFLENWENGNLGEGTAQAVLLLYSSGYEVLDGEKTTMLWKDPDQTQDVIRLKVFYQNPIKTQKQVYYELWSAGTISKEFYDLTFQLIEYDENGQLH